VYVDTRRQFWRLVETGPRFLLTTILLGSATTSLWVASPLQAGLILGASLMLGISEARLWVGSKPGEGMELKRTRDLLQGPLRGEFKLRIILGVLGGILLPVWMLVRGGSDVVAALAAVAFATAIIERHLFFTAVSPNRMPGGL
jgi:formate dehydrogenase iron-sulfur subunit